MRLSRSVSGPLKLTRSDLMAIVTVLKESRGVCEPYSFRIRLFAETSPAHPTMKTPPVQTEVEEAESSAELIKVRVAGLVRDA